MNRFSYTLGNPLKYIDPTGHKEEGACSDPNAECIDDEIYEAYWAYCAENPGDPACEAGDPVELGFWFLVGISGGILVEDLIVIGGGFLGEGVTRAIGWISSLLCGDGNCTNEAESLLADGASASRSSTATRLVPELGRKLEFLLGNATGSTENVSRSRSMLAQLQSIGLRNTAETRAYLMEHLTNALNNPNNVLTVQENGRVIRESLLMGPAGALKVQSVWDGTKLITVFLFGGN